MIWTAKIYTKILKQAFIKQMMTYFRAQSSYCLQNILEKTYIYVCDQGSLEPKCVMVVMLMGKQTNILHLICGPCSFLPEEAPVAVASGVFVIYIYISKQAEVAPN